MKVAPVLILATTLGVFGFASSAHLQGSEKVVDVEISNGHDTDRRDHGRPVILVASALKVPPQIFREAFSHVTPAPAGQEPDPAQVRLNKDALLDALTKYGVTNDRLDEVSNYYRYNGRRETVWKHREAKITATVLDGKIEKITVVDPGAGYSSKPTLTVPGVSDTHLQVTLSFSSNLKSNGSIAKVVIEPSK